MNIDLLRKINEYQMIPNISKALSKNLGNQFIVFIYETNIDYGTLKNIKMYSDYSDAVLDFVGNTYIHDLDVINDLDTINDLDIYPITNGLLRIIPDTYEMDYIMLYKARSFTKDAKNYMVYKEKNLPFDFIIFPDKKSATAYIKTCKLSDDVSIHIKKL